ncbi:hypothetical protein PN36_16855, partial [Candidatus Thiomargarita nelsonii]
HRLVTYDLSIYIDKRCVGRTLRLLSETHHFQEVGGLGVPPLRLATALPTLQEPILRSLNGIDRSVGYINFTLTQIIPLMVTYRK